MTNIPFKFYSVLKNEDAEPYIGGNVLVAADGLGGSGSAVHTIDRTKHLDMHGDIMDSAFGDLTDIPEDLMQYIEETIAPMVDGKDDTSALWASRIVIVRCVYALVAGEFKNADLSDGEVRTKLAEFISAGLQNVVKKFDLQEGKYDGQLLLPTTLAFIRYTENKRSVIAETVWAGDSRCYCLTPQGLKLLSVDDEDESGLITNLFYAGNDKVTLNYLRHEIAKPCALLTVSDGIFDPFAPHVNLGVEYTLLSAIKENKTPDDLKMALYNFFQSVRYDDATMAFVPIGFNCFEDMQKKLSKRTKVILPLRKKQEENYGALEVINQSDEDASHYVTTRTKDKFDYIVSILVEANGRGEGDIALIPGIIEIAEAANMEYKVAFKTAKHHKEVQALIDFYSYVRTNPQAISQIFVSHKNIDFLSNPAVGAAYSKLWIKAEEYVAVVSDKELQTREVQFMQTREFLHQKIMEKIMAYRRQFDAMWGDKSVDSKLRNKIRLYLGIWNNIDLSLQFGWGVCDIGKLSDEDRVLAYKVRDFISACKNFKVQINYMRLNSESLLHDYMAALDVVCKYLEACPKARTVLLTPEAVDMFGFNVSDEVIKKDIGCNPHDSILSELKKSKEVIISGIVQALAENYDKTSLIDGQYNDTKLELFRTFYRLKASGSGEVKALAESISALEKGYTSLVEK